MAATTLIGADNTVITGSTSLELLNKVSNVEGITTGGNFGVNTVLKSAVETELTTTSATSIVTFTPTVNGLFMALVYFRVVTGTTTTTVTVTYNDVTGAQTITPVNAISEPIGSYTVMPVAFAATTAATITVSMTAGTANQIFGSAAIIGL